MSRKAEPAPAGRILATGSRSSEFVENIFGRVRIPVEIWNPADIVSAPPLMVLLFPHSSEELEHLLNRVETIPGSDALPLAVVLKDSSKAESCRGAMILDESDYSLSVLAGACCASVSQTRDSDSMHALGWMRTGFLMPFFIHNMNNMLARIMGNIELAQFHCEDPGRVKDKLEVAMESSEDLRTFLERLSDQTAIQFDDGSAWTIQREDPVFRLGCLASGTSVECTMSREGEFSDSMPAGMGLLNLLAGILSACATRSVAGLGNIRLVSRGFPDRIVLEVRWSRSQGSQPLSDRDSSASSALMSYAAAEACKEGFSFRLGRWGPDSGSASITLFIDDGTDHGK